jgi:hypothetical protein
MPIANVSSYYKLKISINSADGKIDENYNMSPLLGSTTALLQAGMTIVTYRGLLLAAGAAEVKAVLSLEQFTGNRADGIVWSTANLTGPIPMKKLNNTTTETTIEPYGQAKVGPRFELPAVNGKVEKRLLRFVRSSWIAGNQFQGVGVVPMTQAAYLALLAAYPSVPTIAQAIGVFMSFVRDNTVLIKKMGTNFQYATFSSGGVDWMIDAIASREVGEGWDTRRGRKPAYA